MRNLISLFAGLIILGTAMPAMGQQYFSGEYYQKMATTYKRNNCWPMPFVQHDRIAARAPFGVMVHNGWMMQNTVADHHFKPNTSVLSEAGQHHIRWIVTQAPQSRRTVYVQQGMTQEETHARLTAARAMAERFAIDGQMFDVQASHKVPRGWPASYVDAINVKYGDSLPEPRLPQGSGGFGGQ